MKLNIYNDDSNSYLNDIESVKNNHIRLFGKKWYLIIEDNFRCELKKSTDLQDYSEGMDGYFENWWEVKSVAIRGRKWRDRHWNELTIRYETQKYNISEWNKIKSGKTDYYIYYWYDNNVMCEYYLVDINEMRDKGFFDNLTKWNPVPNADGSKGYGISFDLIKDCIVDHKTKKKYKQ